jgi:23S rRNA pseudouridine2605 synthase
VRTRKSEAPRTRGPEHPRTREPEHLRTHVALDRALSKLGLASRAAARRLIVAGRVSVNGHVVRHPTTAVAPASARISIDGTAPAPVVSSRRTLLFHKPRGTVTTRRDPDGRRTVFDVLGDAGRGLVAVGRLDLASTGLLIFTNDTQLANRLTDPAGRVPRRYVVTVRGRLTPDTARRFEEGLVVPGSSASGRAERLSASRVEIRKVSNRETHLIVELVEGKNRELRRLLAAVGHEPTRIHRISFGEYELGDLQPAQWREIDR